MRCETHNKSFGLGFTSINDVYMTYKMVVLFCQWLYNVVYDIKLPHPVNFSYPVNIPYPGKFPYPEFFYILNFYMYFYPF